MKRSLTFIVLISSLVRVAFFAGAEEGGAEEVKKGGLFRETREMMGTVVEIACFTGEENQVKESFVAAFGEIERLEAILSEYRADSAISAVNNAAGKEAVVVPTEVITIFRKALEISELSQGAFDVTFAAVGKLWNFTGDGEIPDGEKIKEKLKLVGYKNVRVDAVKSAIFLQKEGMSAALGGISKGYIVDRSLAVLNERALANCFVNAGGDIAYSGDKGGEAWQIGIRDPDKKREYIAVVSAKGKGAIVTSGDYERFFIKEGRRYHHILDPRTGEPTNNGVRSVTVLAGDAMTADGLATAVFVLGAKKGFALAKKQKGIEVLIMLDSGRTPLMTNGMKEKIKWVE
ncbi:MAG: FAD:protein FMN transferase [Myxococcota bacterium]